MTSQTADPFCPVYREALQAAPWTNAGSAHAGLLFDKFADAWWHDREWVFAFDKGDRSRKDRDKAEHQKESHWVKSVFPGRYAASAQSLGESRLLTEACARQRKLVEKLGGKVVSLTNTDRFVTGMGREHPLENGFAWHHTLGVPYLPGSSLKGMLRAWLREEHGEPGKDRRGNDCWIEPPEVKSQFGTQGQAGRVILLDMLPTEPPQIDVDVMTPHYGPYYQQGEVPGDWHSPVPISFLTVAAGHSWQLGIVPAAGVRAIDQPAVESLSAALLDAIAFCGAGAKTAVGYGRFTKDTAAEERLRKEQEEQRQREQEAQQRAAEEARFQASVANDSEPLQKLKKLQRDQNWALTAGDQNMLAALQQFADENPNPPQDCLDWIRDLLESIQGYKGVWTAPNDMKGKKRNKPKYSSPSIRTLVNRLNPPGSSGR